MFAALTAGAIALSGLTSPISTELPPPDFVTVEVITVNGSGCPAGTSAVAVSPDKTSFTVTYSQFTAQAGAQTGPTDYRKNCQLNLRVNYPQGFTFGIAQADYRGFAHLAKGATGLERANYYFQGQSPTAHKNHKYAGPYSDNWQATDKTDFDAIVFAPCGEVRHLNVNTELRVSTGTSDPAATSFMSMDSTDGAVDTKYHFAWKTC